VQFKLPKDALPKERENKSSSYVGGASVGM
jgi:hypothetical protein